MNTYTVELETRFAAAGSEENTGLDQAKAWLEMMHLMHGKDNERIDCKILVNGEHGISRVSMKDGLSFLGDMEMEELRKLAESAVLEFDEDREQVAILIFPVNGEDFMYSEDGEVLLGYFEKGRFEELEFHPVWHGKDRPEILSERQICAICGLAIEKTTTPEAPWIEPFLKWAGRYSP